jgi:hypothetical protein
MHIMQANDSLELNDMQFVAQKRELMSSKKVDGELAFHLK